MNRRKLLDRGCCRSLPRHFRRARRRPCSKSPELYAGEKALYEAAKKEGMVVSASIPDRPGPTGRPSSRPSRSAIPSVEIVYNDIGSAATVVALDKARNRPQADTAYYFAASALDAGSKDVVAPLQAGEFRQAAAGVPRSRRQLVHHPHADRRVPRQHQAGQERAAVVGRSAEAGIQERHRLSRSALDRRRAGGGLRRQLRQWRRHGQCRSRASTISASCTKAGNVLRVVGTTPYAQFVKGEIPIWIGYENDGLKAKYTDGLGDARGGRDSEGSVGGRAVRDQPGEERPEPECRQALAQLHHDRHRPGNLRRRASCGRRCRA